MEVNETVAQYQSARVSELGSVVGRLSDDGPISVWVVQISCSDVAALRRSRDDAGKTVAMVIEHRGGRHARDRGEGHARDARSSHDDVDRTATRGDGEIPAHVIVRSRTERPPYQLSGRAVGQLLAGGPRNLRQPSLGIVGEVVLDTVRVDARGDPAMYVVGEHVRAGH